MTRSSCRDSLTWSCENVAKPGARYKPRKVLMYPSKRYISLVDNDKEGEPAHVTSFCCVKCLDDLPFGSCFCLWKEFLLFIFLGIKWTSLNSRLFVLVPINWAVLQRRKEKMTKFILQMFVMEKLAHIYLICRVVGFQVKVDFTPETCFRRIGLNPISPGIQNQYSNLLFMLRRVCCVQVLSKLLWDNEARPWRLTWMPGIYSSFQKLHWALCTLTLFSCVKFNQKRMQLLKWFHKRTWLLLNHHL